MNNTPFFTTNAGSYYSKQGNRNNLRATYSSHNQSARDCTNFFRERQLQFQNKKNQFFQKFNVQPSIKRDKWQQFDNYFRGNDFNPIKKNERVFPKKMDNKSFDLRFQPFDSRNIYPSKVYRPQNQINYDPNFRLKSLQNETYIPPYQNYWENKKFISRNAQLRPQDPQTKLNEDFYDTKSNNQKYDLGYCKTTPNQKLRWSNAKEEENPSENIIDFKRRSLHTSKIDNPQKYNVSGTNGITKQTEKIQKESLPKVYKKEDKQKQALSYQNQMKKSEIKEIVKKQQAQKPITKKREEKKLKISDFKIIKRMGKGRLGEVLLVVHKETRGVFAIKKLLKKQILEHELVKYLIQQIKYQAWAQNPYIIKLYAVFDDLDAVYLVMQLAEDGSLEGLMNTNKYHTPKVKIFEHNTLKQMYLEILNGLKRLHQLQLVHRDLKPGNIVLVCGVCKICDFGWVSSVSENKRRDTYCGSMGYAAPQIFEDMGYGISVDMWEFGVIAYELLTGKLPFCNRDERTAIDELKNFTGQLTYPAGTPEQFKDFISKFLKKNPEQRCSIKEMLNHPLLQKIQS